MNPNIQHWLTRIEKDRKELCDSLSGISQEKFTKAPTPGKWSISEISSHLLAADRLSLTYMKKKSQAIDSVGEAGWIEDLKMMLFVVSQRLPLKYRAPTAIVQNTPKHIDPATLWDEWNSLLLDYQEFLVGIPEPYIRRKIYKHPILGRIDARLCLQSLHAHYHHHLPQIKRLL